MGDSFNFRECLHVCLKLIHSCSECLSLEKNGSRKSDEKLAIYKLQSLKKEKW